MSFPWSGCACSHSSAHVPRSYAKTPGSASVGVATLVNGFDIGADLPIFMERQKGRNMPLNIKSPETDRVVRELAELTGESITETVTRAVEERLQRERARRRAGTVRAEVMRIRERYRTLPLLDDRSADEIIGYDERGLPGG